MTTLDQYIYLIKRIEEEKERLRKYELIGMELQRIENKLNEMLQKYDN